MVNSKKIFGLLGASFCVLGCLFTNAFCGPGCLDTDSKFSDALYWAYEHGLTKYNNSEEFRPRDGLRRDEATKFLINFTKGQFELFQSSNNCNFTDLNLARKDLKDYINQACKFGIVNGFKNKFMPNEKLTNEQIVAMVARVEFGKQDEKNVSRWSDNYYKVMSNYDLNAFQNKAAAATRGDVITLLYDVINENYIPADELEISNENVLEELVNSLD